MSKEKFKYKRRSVLLSGLNLLALGAMNVKAQDVKPLTIGVLTDMSGIYGDVTGQGSVIAAKMAMEDFLAQGGRSTRPIKIISADHQNKADIAAATARQWIDREGVDVIVDLPNSAVALAVNNIVQGKNKVMLVSGASSSDLTGKNCSPNTIQWTYDTHALAAGAATAITQSGGKTWFNLTVDYAFGHAMARDLANTVAKNGGKVIGSVLTPLNTPDFSSFLLQAQSSKAQVIGLINAGGDTINSIKQAVEFGITNSKQRLVATVLYINDVHALGLPIAQGLQFTEAFYWDLNAQTRAWSQRYAKRLDGRYPSALQAGVYSSVLHYLRAATALEDPKDGKRVVEKMKALATDDPLFGKGSIRVDGRKIHDMYLFEVKKPQESKYPWDYYHVVKTIPAADVWRPLSEGGCSFVKSS
ncbi:ABC transporter substrate-binding protein [Pollutimonas bauzanensis]|uniref:Branched-chain amino acid transport system substrate-binding protein n=1 Tax=Pollutimonas bauzanensis TaxID=658167 RepID=A0A1M5YNX8_9BURK|nr:branched-chain amino acid transport system substrate-binding protein [Pollutimonas bauzanensis]